jgi:hypothetical protein
VFRVHRWAVDLGGTYGELERSASLPLQKVFLIVVAGVSVCCRKNPVCIVLILWSCKCVGTSVCWSVFVSRIVQLERERVYLELREVIAIVFGGQENGLSDPRHLALCV